VVLFDRSGHRTKFTNVGRMLLERGRVLLEAADKLTTDAEALARGWETHLTLVTEALVPTTALYPLVDRLADTSRNALINIVTIALGLTVGSKLSAEAFLQMKTLGILVLGMVAFCGGTAAGIFMAKVMNRFSENKINPLIGSAGVSAVPMAARVSNKVGLEANPQNFLLMHAMGPNVAGVIGSAVAAGVLLNFVG